MNARRGRPHRGTTPAALLMVIMLPLGSCSGSPQAPDTAPSRVGAAEFAVVSGRDGLAVTGAGWFEQVPGFDVSGGDSVGFFSVETAGLDATSAAVVGAGHIGVVRAHQPATIVDCADCAGVAVTNEFILTSRKNFRPDNGLDIVLYNHDLTPARTIPAPRLEERATTDYPGENTESPVTLAADRHRITLGYLSRAGGVRRGPSVLAQYDYAGTLLRSVMVDGILGDWAVSPDGRRLAVGVGGSGGYCVTSSAPVVVDLETLQVRKIEPEVPGVVSSGSDPWFLLTDLVWRDGVLSVVGEVHDPPPGETCDPDPEIWRRGFEATTGVVTDTGGRTASATRWIGPECGDVLEITGGYADAVLLRRSGGTEERLGSYARMNLGRSVPEKCG